MDDINKGYTYKIYLPMVHLPAVFQIHVQQVNGLLKTYLL